MYPTRDELKQVFSREEPSAGFTARVMQQVRAEKKVRGFPYKRWSIVGAIAASLTVGVYVRQQQRRAHQADPVVSEHADQLYQALGLAGVKIDKARAAVLQSEGEDAQ
jgi:hypothetical protein